MMGIFMGVVIYLIFAFFTFLLVAVLDGRFSREEPEDSISAVVLGMTWPFTLSLGIGLILMLAAFELWDRLYGKVFTLNRGDKE
ncbi:TPA: hypothetical protein QH731_003561 [Klebsiella variicola]|nr:hypothetical protein [Klebsiella variicola]